VTSPTPVRSTAAQLPLDNPAVLVSATLAAIAHTTPVITAAGRNPIGVEPPIGLGLPEHH